MNHDPSGLFLNFQLPTPDYGLSLPLPPPFFSSSGQKNRDQFLLRFHGFPAYTPSPQFFFLHQKIREDYMRPEYAHDHIRPASEHRSQDFVLPAPGIFQY